MTSIHRIILRRLVVAWALVSVVVGGLAVYLELRQIDQGVLALARQQAASFLPEGLDSSARSPDQQAQLAARAEEYLKRNFVFVELYGPDGKKLVDAVNPDFSGIEEAVAQSRLAFQRHGRSYYEKLAIGDQTLVQVLVPLPAKDGRSMGYFEGLFLVDPQTLYEFRTRLTRNLAAVLLTVLVTTLLLYPVIIRLNRDLLRVSHEVLKGNLELASVLGAAIAKRDSETGAHNYRVALYALALGEKEGLGTVAMRDLIAGAFLHDVGKIGISDTILLKPGPLTPDEEIIMHSHPTLGAEIVSSSNSLRGAREVIENHHEKYDGSGYPQGLRDTEIPLNARIFTIVDVFDALTSRRPYKDPMPVDQALRIIGQDAGSHFDPALVRTFLPIARRLFARLGTASEADLNALLRHKAMPYIFKATHATAPSNRPV